MATDNTVLAGPAQAGPPSTHGPLFRFFFVHEIDEYPSGGKRTGYLALAVLATIVLYYTYFTQTGVTPQILRYFHMSFAYYVAIVIVSNLLGAFASLPASKTDQLGRSNVIIYGLLIIGVLVAVGVPLCKTQLEFFIVISLLGVVEGAILVATPALVRDFSPQLGRASAMGFWTVGPVAGSLLTSVVATNTIDHFLRTYGLPGWKSQFIISGGISVLVFVVSLFFMKDLSKRLREQLMVSQHDRALVEAKARGISEDELVTATRHPWRQILKWDLVGSALGISVFLLLYYAASGFFTIFWATVYRDHTGLNLSTSQANYLNIWFWSADAVALIVFGIISDKLRVRKPLMLIGAVGSIVFLVLFARQTDHPSTGFGTLITLEVLLAVCISLTYAPWMAGYTEMVEARNPALVGTGLALWGWILRLTVGLSFIFLPLVVTSVNPVVDNLAYAQTFPGGTAPFNVQQFQIEHPQLVAFATTNASWLRPLSDPKNANVVAAAHFSPTAANLAALQKAVGPAVVTKVLANLTEVNGPVWTYRTQLAYLSVHQNQLTSLLNGVGKAHSQWKNWFWVSVGGMVLFIPTIWLNRGRWSPKNARKDEAKHEEDVAQELRELVGANA
ncbi:MAG: MFS transporter [Acidimicrobiales bacterium]|nr:MFS transporter [Acidimicrobiales bacterium]